MKSNAFDLLCELDLMSTDNRNEKDRLIFQLACELGLPNSCIDDEDRDEFLIKHKKAEKIVLSDLTIIIDKNS